MADSRTVFAGTRLSSCMHATASSDSAGAAEIPLDRDVFCRTLIRELAGSLEETVGLEAASGYISMVGARMGGWLDEEYRRALGAQRLDHDQVAAVLTDLKRRIGGTFTLDDEASSDRLLVYDNGRCPFEEKVEGRESMCMMTSNVFGSIAARNLGYGKVELQKTIARGDGRCRVLVHTDPSAAEAQQAEGREYFGD